LLAKLDEPGELLLERFQVRFHPSTIDSKILLGQLLTSIFECYLASMPSTLARAGFCIPVRGCVPACAGFKGLT
jgi:hypothetical protein